MDCLFWPIATLFQECIVRRIIASLLKDFVLLTVITFEDSRRCFSPLRSGYPAFSIWRSLRLTQTGAASASKRPRGDERMRTQLRARPVCPNEANPYRRTSKTNLLMCRSGYPLKTRSSTMASHLFPNTPAPSPLPREVVAPALSNDLTTQCALGDGHASHPLAHHRRSGQLQIQPFLVPSASKPHPLPSPTLSANNNPHHI